MEWAASEKQKGDHYDFMNGKMVVFMSHTRRSFN